MIIKKSNTYLIRSLREQIREQRRLITALEELARLRENIIIEMRRKMP